MKEGWIKIYSASEEYQAELIKKLLEKNGLQPVLMDKKDDEFRLGVAELYLSPEQAEKGKLIIEENQKKPK